MWLKYLVGKEQNVGLKYSPIKQTLIIGGHIQQYDGMEYFINTYVNPECKVVREYPNHNKVRFTIEYNEDSFNQLKQLIELHDIPFNPVESHGRLFR